jgi:hypothetical protein
MRLEQLFEGLSLRLEASLKELTELERKENETLRRIADWLSVSDLDYSRDARWSRRESLTAWRDVSRFVSEHILRTTWQLATERTPQPISTAPVHILDVLRATPELDCTITVRSDELVALAWDSLHQEQLRHLTGLEPEENHLVVSLAVEEILSWAGGSDMPVVLPADDGYLLLRNDGDSRLRAMAMGMGARPGFFVAATPQPDTPDAVSLRVGSFAGTMSHREETETLFATASIATAIEESSTVALVAAHSGVLSIAAEDGYLEVGGVAKVRGVSFEPSVCSFGEGWVLSEQPEFVA